MYASLLNLVMLKLHNSQKVNCVLTEISTKSFILRIKIKILYEELREIEIKMNLL